MKKERRGLRFGAAVILAAAVLFLAAVDDLDRRQGEEGRKQLEQALRTAAVACYAAEGIYPPDVDYLKEHYGVQVDERRYAVFYEAFAENLLPEITVVELS